MSTPPPPPPPEFVRLPLPPGVSEHGLADARETQAVTPPSGYRQQAAARPQASGARTWMNVTSFIMGLLCFFGVTALAAIVLGHMGVAASRRGEANLSGLGIAGLILGYFGLVVAIGVGLWG